MDYFLYLNTTSFAGAFHSRGHVDGVTPNIVVRFPGADDAGRDGAVIDTQPQYKMVKGLLINGR